MGENKRKYSAYVEEHVYAQAHRSTNKDRE